MPKKILFIANYRAKVGGISGQVDILLSHLDKNLFETTLLNTKMSPFKRFLLFFTASFKILKYDIIHIHACSHLGGFFPAIFGVFLGKLFRKKIVLTYHGGDAEAFFHKYPRLVFFTLKRADKLIVLSDFLAQIFKKYKLEVTIIPNIRLQESTISRNKSEIKPNFVSLRALESLYNIDFILDAFKEVKSKYPNAKLTLVGSGSQKDFLIEKCKTEHIESVEFVGRVPNDEVLNYLNQADILLSAPKIDNMPISVLEAFETEVLVISSNVGGIPYMISHQENGLLFESGNQIDLAEKMIFALENQTQSLEMIQKAKQTLNRYAWEENEAKFNSIYNSL
ncbi:MAG: glycosyltransferase family 4 protein [Bacteroidota bacterium]